MAMYQRHFASSIHALRLSLESWLKKLKRQLEQPWASQFGTIARWEEHWRDIGEWPEEEIPN
ncbi:hypothetical protein EM20IM_06125 [Candidatus Methylacidiphilum infernorum]|uniref:Uncharacterized protein n=1 Tax=Candidatus Methylacidiphilum infernorum TaxID=511746 RepID=A0ABX7PTT2_9BACT|nr:hypothetical protein [Candidatus Methylacidiphilum infernorum]QSR86088.1 hypothetical protein EM20IM_06125 [Candidatus Methylacidiphilum infernorum]